MTTDYVRYDDMTPEQQAIHDAFLDGLRQLVSATPDNANHQADNVIQACIDAGHHQLNQICHFATRVGLKPAHIVMRLQTEAKAHISRRRWHNAEGNNYYLLPALTAQPKAIVMSDLNFSL
jgi:hypothetical protein